MEMEEILIFTIKYKTEIIIAVAAVLVVCLFCWYCRWRDTDEITFIRNESRVEGSRIEGGYADIDYHRWSTDSVISHLPSVLRPLLNYDTSCVRIGVGAGTGALREVVQKYLTENSHLYRWNFEASKNRFFVYRSDS